MFSPQMCRLALFPFFAAALAVMSLASSNGPVPVGAGPSHPQAPRLPVITTVIFDLGGVLLDWDPQKFVAALHPDTVPAASSGNIAPNSLIRNHILKGISSTLAWKEYNRGTLTLQQAAETFAETKLASVSASSSGSTHPPAPAPDPSSHCNAADASATSCAGATPTLTLALLESLFLDFAHRVPSLMVPLPPGVEALRRVRAAGYRTLILSNFPKDNYEAVQARLPWLFELFDGAVVSYQVRAMKPDAAIYAHLLETYRLSPSECVFVDDKQENLDGAAAAGILGVPNTDNSIGLVGRLTALGLLPSDEL